MNKNNKRGFTLLELLVSLAIITVILLAFFRVLNSTNKVNAKNDRDIKAMNIAQTEVENLRKQIKTKSDTLKDRDLLIYNDLKPTEDKSEKIEFKENKTRKEYTRILENKNGKGNRYNIKLDIERDLIQGNKNKIKTSFNDYKYTIDISVELESNQKYFSKKVTELNDIQILGSSSGVLEGDEGNNGGSDNEETEKPANLSEYHIRVHTIDEWNLDVANESFKVANKSSIPSFNDRALGPTNLNIKDNSINIKYMPNGVLEGDPFMQMEVSNDSQKYTYKEYGFIYQDYNYINIYIEHTGMQLNNLVINGEKINTVNKNIKKKINKNQQGITLEFNGATKVSSGDMSGPNSGIRSDIFITFSN